MLRMHIFQLIKGVVDEAIEAQLKEKFMGSINKSSSKPAEQARVRKTIVVPKGSPSKGSVAGGGRSGRRRVSLTVYVKYISTNCLLPPRLSSPLLKKTKHPIWQ